MHEITAEIHHGTATQLGCIPQFARTIANRRPEVRLDVLDLADDTLGQQFDDSVP